jgi:hypothetical protein
LLYELALGAHWPRVTNTGFRTFGIGYGGFHSECNSPSGDKIRNIAQYGNLDTAKLVMVTGDYDGNIDFMWYGIASSQCFSNITTWDFGDYSGAASDDVVNVFAR